MTKQSLLFLLAALSLVSHNVFAEKLDDLLDQQSNAKAEKKLSTAKDEVIAEYRELLSAQLDNTGRLIWDRFEYKGADDVLSFSPSDSLDENLSQAVYAEYKIPQGCIGSAHYFQPIIANLLTATYAKNETIKQKALTVLSSDLEGRRVWIASGESSTPGLCTNSYNQFKKMLNDILIGVQDAPQDAIKLRKQMTEQRDAEIQARNASEKAQIAEAEQKKAAQVDAEKAKEQQNYQLCTKEYGVPATVVKRTLNMYAGGMVGLCRFVLGARDAGVGITFGKGSDGAPYSIEMKKGSGRITMGLDVLKDVVTGEENNLLLVPVSYSINGPSKRLENANDLGKLLMGISSMIPPKI